MNEAYRLRYTNQIVGIFLLVFLLFLFVVSVLVFRINFFVRPDTFLVDVSEDAIGDLHRGADVMILGEHAGEVEDLRYDDQTNRVRVELAIDRDKSSLITDDSIVQLERKFGVGAPILVIRRGDSELQPQRSDSGALVLPFLPETDRVDELAVEVEEVSESIRKIQQALDPTLESIDEAADRFQQTLNDSVDPALSQSSEASASFLRTNETLRPDIQQTTETFRAATLSIETRIADLTEKIELLVEQDMRRTLAEVRESTDDVSDAAKSVNQSVNQDVAQTLAEMRVAIDEVRRLAQESRDVVRIVRSEADDLPGTTARVNDTISDAQDLVNEIRNHWLLRKYTRRSSTAPQISPSVVRGGSFR